MKRILGVLLLVGVMVTPTIASAGEQIGIYVAPKFVYGLTQMDSFKGHFNEAGDSYSQSGGSRTDDTFGGSIAIGYDFDKKFGQNLNMPVSPRQKPKRATEMKILLLR